MLTRVSMSAPAAACPQKTVHSQINNKCNGETCLLVLRMLVRHFVIFVRSSRPAELFSPPFALYITEGFVTEATQGFSQVCATVKLGFFSGSGDVPSSRASLDCNSGAGTTGTSFTKIFYYLTNLCVAQRLRNIPSSTEVQSKSAP